MERHSNSNAVTLNLKAYCFLIINEHIKFNMKNLLNKLETIAGTLITTKHILSAAHCINPNLYVENLLQLKILNLYIFSFNFYSTISFVRLGEFDTRHEDDGPHEDIEVSSSVQHENYNDLLKVNDIMILYLRHHVVFKGK